MKTLLRGIATLLTAALLCFNLFYEMAPGIVVGPEKKLAFAAAFAILLRIAMFCGIPEAQRQRRRRLYMQLLLYYYMWVLANVLFFDNAFGRGFTMHATLDAVNLEPLRTIRNYLLAYGYGNIHCKDARKRLGHGQQVKEVFAVYPAVIGDNLALYNRNHGPPAAKGEGADVKHAEKQLDQPPGGGLFLFRFHFLSPPARYYSA